MFPQQAAVCLARGMRWPRCEGMHMQLQRW
jgi:hypothetical protein